MKDDPDETIGEQPTQTSPLKRAIHEVEASGGTITAYGHYLNLQFLGQGGMARVYKGWDPTLNRPVALKFLRVEDPDWRLRLMMEARAQARIEHENVCKVYEVGEAEGRQYIAMQYIDGRTLTEAIPALSLEQKVQVMRRVAAAMQEAHRLGLIHRDLKPTNIMVEKTESGEFVPYVMDFGLAREVQAAGMTITGFAMGTPSYMSPEQARGDTTRIDRRTDIYSIGATLYEALTLQPPHNADSSMAILNKVISEEPALPRKLNPSIPVDLEKIVMKCLEKEPERRYESAKALADDLGRYLSGDPVVARRAGLLYRMNKRIRKNPVVSALLGAAAIIALVSAAAAITTLWRAQAQEQLQREFGQKAQEVEGIMRFAYLLPLHDVTPERRMVQQRLSELQERMKLIGKTAAGPGSYALGRGYLALHQYEKARQELEHAWSLDRSRSPEIAYALGLTLALLYQKNLEDAAHIRSKQDREARIRVVENEYRAPALRLMQQSRASTEAPEYVEALVDFLEKKYEAAGSKAQTARKRVPWMYEADKLRGDCLAAEANQSRDSGDYKRAVELYNNAENAYRTAMQAGSSDADVYQAVCEMHSDLLDLYVYETGENPEPAFKNGVSDCNQAIRAVPDHSQTYKTLMDLHIIYAYYQIYTAEQNARPTLDQAVQHGKKSMELDPGNSFTLSRLGRAYVMRAEYEMGQEQDPLPWLDAAESAFDRAIRIRKEDSAPYVGRATGEYYRALFEMERGKDPTASIHRAVENQQNAIQLQPNRAGYYRDLGAYFLLQVEYDLSRGQDITSSVQNTETALKKATAINPGEEIAFFNLGQVNVFEAAQQVSRGKDPSVAVHDAVDTLQKALQINASDDYAYTVLGGAYLQQAQYEVDSANNPQPQLQQARQSLEKAITMAPDHHDAYSNLAGVYRLEAEFLMDQKLSPDSALSKGRAVLARGKKISAVDVSELLMQEPQMHALEMQWNILHGRSPEPFFTAGLKEIEAVLKLNPRLPEAYETLAELYRRRSEWKLQHKQPADQDIEEGLKNSDVALSYNPQLAKSHATKGILYSLLAGEASAPEKQKLSQNATEAFRRAFEINPLLKRKYNVSSQQ